MSFLFNNTETYIFKPKIIEPQKHLLVIIKVSNRVLHNINIIKMVSSSESLAAFSDLVLIFWPFSDHLKHLVRILDKVRIFWPIGSTVNLSPFTNYLGDSDGNIFTSDTSQYLEWNDHVIQDTTKSALTIQYFLKFRGRKEL